jgi:hypothetical protein
VRILELKEDVNVISTDVCGERFTVWNSLIL